MVSCIFRIGKSCYVITLCLHNFIYDSMNALVLQLFLLNCKLCSTGEESGIGLKICGWFLGTADTGGWLSIDTWCHGRNVFLWILNYLLKMRGCIPKFWVVWRKTGSCLFYSSLFLFHFLIVCYLLYKILTLI